MIWCLVRTHFLVPASSRGGRGRGLLIRALILSWGLPPHDLTSSPRPHLLTPSHWELGFNYEFQSGVPTNWDVQ